MKAPNALSVDLEDWYHPELVRRHLGSAPAEGRIVESTRPLLDLLARHDVRATFFVVGEVMQRHPDLICEIHDQGHEIACHGMTHRPLWELTPASFEEELAEFGRLSRQILGSDVRIRGFRAPTFSLDRRTSWAVRVLEQHGYEYDASVFPVRVGLYGQPSAPLEIYRLDADDPTEADSGGRMLEFPPATYELGRWRFPVGGGAYLRLLPAPLLVRALKRIEEQRPFVIYLHPWETAPQIPRVELPAWARVVTYAGIGSALEKLEKLLQTFQFTTVHEVLRSRQAHRVRSGLKSPAIPAAEL